MLEYRLDDNDNPEEIQPPLMTSNPNYSYLMHFKLNDSFLPTGSAQLAGLNLKRAPEHLDYLMEHYRPNGSSSDPAVNSTSFTEVVGDSPDIGFMMERIDEENTLVMEMTMASGETLRVADEDIQQQLRACVPGAIVAATSDSNGLVDSLTVLLADPYTAYMEGKLPTITDVSEEGLVGIDSVSYSMGDCSCVTLNLEYFDDEMYVDYIGNAFSTPKVGWKVFFTTDGEGTLTSLYRIFVYE